MNYLRRRKLRGLALKRITVVLDKRRYEDLLCMKGTLNNSEAVEQLIRGEMRRLQKRLIKAGLKKSVQIQRIPEGNGTKPE